MSREIWNAGPSQRLRGRRRRSGSRNRMSDQRKGWFRIETLMKGRAEQCLRVRLSAEVDKTLGENRQGIKGLN